MELKDKVVVITGGSKGFGKALAEAFIREGAKVSICALNERELIQAAKDIGAFSLVADVRNVKDMENLANETIKKYGSLDIWVNNAGIWVNNEPAENNDLEKVKKMIDVNVTGLINGSVVALRIMKKENKGTIINILSGAGLASRPGIATYSASKWAGKGFTDGVREENKNTNLKFLSVYPGGLKTEIFGNYKYADFDNFMDVKDVTQKVIENLKKETPEPELIVRRETL